MNQRERQARIFVKLLEAKYALQSVERLLALPDDKQCAAGLIVQVESFRGELRDRAAAAQRKVMQVAATTRQGA